MSDPTAPIMDALETVCPTVLDSRVSDAPQEPWLLVDADPGTLSTTLGSRPLATIPVRIMTVNNNPAGCRLLATKARDILDGLRIDGYRLTHRDTGPVLEDRNDPSNYRWSCTQTFTLTARRTP
ncbi:hypothetical protein FYJ43_04380 [Cutibacterium sp. WCA-380-WT-3A]|uniref:DUF3168 domain-containing protein n=1 Tax=Cutibacterium porci TaxID=2605781 RepID=A0A7K0J5T2_9ACTN|nr:hypothetical protein [Cutibacterium porci]MSS45294.1 hypothetical protein [Cutibacterium porci]